MKTILHWLFGNVEITIADRTATPALRATADRAERIAQKTLQLAEALQKLEGIDVPPLPPVTSIERKEPFTMAHNMRTKLTLVPSGTTCTTKAIAVMISWTAVSIVHHPFEIGLS